MGKFQKLSNSKCNTVKSVSITFEGTVVKKNVKDGGGNSCGKALVC